MIRLPQQPAVLLFNFKAEPRTLRIARYLESGGVEVRSVLPADFGRPLGALFELPGCEDAAAAPFAAFSEELLVMRGFDQARLDAFLRFFRGEGLRRVEYKAVLTPSNADWNAAVLLSRLKQERVALESRLRR